MKGAIFYYSGSGNTRLACRYLAANVPAVDFDLIDITQETDVDLTPYDVVGFAAWTDFFGPSQLFKDFVADLPAQQDKLAFVFNTYGAMTGKTLRSMAQLVEKRGFRVIGGYSLQTPESYPKNIARGMAFTDAPDAEALGEFDAFIASLDRRLDRAHESGTVEAQRVRIGLLNTLMPRFPRTKAKNDMGPKYVDEAKCTECGICEQLCPYDAIELAPKPIFDEDACYGCWRCYNHCPEQAIYTDDLKGDEAQYPRPNDQLKKKLNV